MKATIRGAGLLGSLAFLAVGLGGFLATRNPLQSLLYGLAASAILGMIGWKMGHIISHPAGRKKPPKPVNTNNTAVTPGGLQPAPPGEETLLELPGS